VTNADIAKQLAERLEALAREQADSAHMVMLSIEYVSPVRDGEVAAKILRQTRTLLFLEAEFHSADATLIARASSVHALGQGAS
jgi:acyl-coenzyme A thioesterase PaaI-like protein